MRYSIQGDVYVVEAKRRAEIIREALRNPDSPYRALALQSVDSLEASVFENRRALAFRCGWLDPDGNGIALSEHCGGTGDCCGDPDNCGGGARD